MLKGNHSELDLLNGKPIVKDMRMRLYQPILSQQRLVIVQQHYVQSDNGDLYRQTPIRLVEGLFGVLI